MLRRCLASLFGVVLLASMLPNVAFAENYCINPFQYGPGRIQITLTPSGFDPSTVTVPLGTELNWLNCTGIDATVNSDPYPTNEFWNWLNLGAWPGDGSSVVQVIPPSTGTFTYHNHYNPSQTGTLIVTAHGKQASGTKQTFAVVPTSGRVTQVFGGSHKGIDINTTPGASLTQPGNAIYAIAPGTIARARCDAKSGYGRYVVVDHGDLGDGTHLFSLYAHMGGGDGSDKAPHDDCARANLDGSPKYGDWIASGIVEGQPVSQGALLGYQGASGAATGVHLHFEVMTYKALAYGGSKSQTDPTGCIGGQNAVGNVYSALTFGHMCPAS